MATIGTQTTHAELFGPATTPIHGMRWRRIRVTLVNDGDTLDVDDHGIRAVQFALWEADASTDHVAVTISAAPDNDTINFGTSGGATDHSGYVWVGNRGF